MAKLPKKQREELMFLQEDIKLLEKTLVDHTESNNKKPSEHHKMLIRTYTEILKDLKTSLAKLTA